MTITRSIQNVVDTLTANPDISYRESMMLVCYAAVDHGDHDPDHFHDYPLSSNITQFRDIRCLFRYGGPRAHAEDSFFWEWNQWPLHWDRWGPPGESVGPYTYNFETFSWRKAVSYMSVERADKVLKAHGHHGPYEMVGIQKTPAYPDGEWRFFNVRVTDQEGGGQRTFNVDVRTGRVDVDHWWEI